MGGESMLTNSIIYLAAAVIFVPIASRLKLGSVLGYLVAGCAIGPFGLRLAGDHAATMHFAEIGVVLMLFLIGLELDPKKLWAMRRAVFGGGGLQLGACGAATTAGLTLCGLPWQAAIIGGLALALSSTAVSMQTMAEKNLLKSPMGQATFAVLLFQDIAAVPLLAIVPLLAVNRGTIDASSWLHFAGALGAIVAVVLIGRFLIRPLLRIVAGSGLREVFTAFTLLLVLGIAMLMASVGLSMGLGAFLAGVLLASSEYRHALQTDVEPFKGLLMGLFFIAVGMSIDFAFLGTHPWVVLGLVLGYQIVKGVALRLVAGGIGVAKPSRWQFAALLAQGGEFAFVVFGVARAGGVLPGNWDALLTLTVALSMALTPLLFALERRMTGVVTESREADTIEDDSTPVIIAGFGRFGQIVGRLLFASGIKATVLDHDPQQIDSIRRFNFRVYYGDATRIDLLEAAGAANAAILINAIDDPETSLGLVDAVREHFPKLTILARARNVGHYYQLRARGVELLERETFESALAIGHKALTRLGVGPYEARERVDRFRRQNLSSLEAILPHWQDEERRVQMSVSAREQLETQMEIDRSQLALPGSHGWHGETVSNRGS
jgi:glutathione-regulated potassium-efflux system ancillary protein KefC